MKKILVAFLVFSAIGDVINPNQIILSDNATAYNIGHAFGVAIKPVFKLFLAFIILKNHYPWFANKGVQNS